MFGQKTSHTHSADEKSEHTIQHWTRENPDNAETLKVKFEKCKCGAERNGMRGKWGPWI